MRGWTNSPSNHTYFKTDLIYSPLRRKFHDLFGIQAPINHHRENAYLLCKSG